MTSPIIEVQSLFGKLRIHWLQFLVIHVSVNLLVFLILAPALSLLLHLAVSLSGNAALSDQDIVLFFISPLGFSSLLLIGALASIVIFLEHAALLSSVVLSKAGGLVSVTQVLAFLGQRVTRLFGLALLVLIRVLLNLLPFVLAIGGVYVWLLSDYDINYYLAEQPPEWWRAIALGALIALLAACNLLRLFVSWIFCLPLLLFAGVGPLEALRQSRRAVRGHRLQAGAWLGGWLLFSLLITLAVSALLSGAGGLLIPRMEDSVDTLLLTIGMLSLSGFVLSFLVTLTETGLLSLLNLKLYFDRDLPEPPAAVIPGDRVARQWLPGRGYLVLAALAMVLFTATAAYLLVNRLNLEQATEIMAHRGASAAAPENTLAAISAAIDAGAHWVEIDVQETLDDRIVVIHDSDLKKIAGNPMTVATSTAGQLGEVDIGSWFDGRFSDQRIPLLSEVLEMCKGRIGVNIELKYYGRERQLEQRVIDLVEAAGMVDDIVVMSLNLKGIQQVRRLRPHWTVGLLSTVAIGNLAALDVDFLALNGRAANRAMIRNAHKHDKEIMVWTVNDPIGINSMISRGVDAIITDEPALATSVLQQREQLEPVELLLIKLADIFEQPALYREQ